MMEPREINQLPSNSAERQIPSETLRERNGRGTNATRKKENHEIGGRML